MSVIIPVFNSKQCLRQCLDSVIRAVEDYGPAELIAIDNGSTDGSYEVLSAEYGCHAKVCRLEGSTISALRNYGARIGKGQYLCFIDSDCVVPPDYFHKVVGVFCSVEADVTGCMYRLPSNPHWIERTWQDLHEHVGDGYVHFINSGNFAIRRAAFEQSGGFNEALTTGEDSEYCLRLLAGGHRIFESQSVSAVHLGNPKTLADFFRKHAWHGLGMFGSLGLSRLDKPLWMTFGFLGFSGAGGLALLLVPAGVGVRLALLALGTLCVPLATVAYRAKRRGRLSRPLRSVLLYWLYYAARVKALLAIALQRAWSGTSGKG